MRIKDIKEGVKVGKLTAVRPWGTNHKKQPRWLFKCDCGNYHTSIIYKLPESCGHCGTHFDDLKDNRQSSLYYKLYQIWRGIRNRCSNIRCSKYKNYGGRGIKVCEEWDNSYSIFKKWALENGYVLGLSKKEQSIDRINVNGNYEPDNCRWANIKTQNRNRRSNIYVIYQEDRISLIELSERINIDYRVLQSRYYRGVRGDDLVLPSGELINRYSIHDEMLTVKEIAQKYDVSESSIRSRIKRNTLNKLKRI